MLLCADHSLSVYVFALQGFISSCLFGRLLALMNISVIDVSMLDAATFVEVIVGGSKLGLGLYLVLLPMHAVKVLTSGALWEKDLEVGLAYNDLQALAFVCLGLFFLVPSALSLTSSLYTFTAQGLELSGFSDLQNLFYLLLHPLIMTLIGIWLIFGGKGLMNPVRRLRTIAQSS
ncbi:hypothetical protein [Cohaesibacter gelatinilyticus]|uniref:Uncharacterized protein n=1 Tax=Cohaesibacter gelatinilyticus TaxID=372072 RepID=A0A285NHE2_9HYPH|nr:hypothetical protein [Cohaesibacter gelatinilyticus]SNZ08333.1 hypothetical protein SAMN06265368_1580 [Cohaesibacter gelatinilyticus]